MQISATHINYYYVCHRKLWLFSNGINMEHTSEIVYDGKLLHETSYPQRVDKHKEIDISAVTANGVQLSGKIDFYDAKEKTIHETKRSDRVELAHEWQAKYYIWLLELNDIIDVRAVLEYPKLRSTTLVSLTDPDKVHLQQIICEIVRLHKTITCPPTINSKICKSCSYYDLCYIE